MTTDEHVPLRPTFQKLEMSLTHISNKSLTHPVDVGGTQNWWTNRRTSRKPINQISDTHDYRRACATETHFSETRNVCAAYKQHKSNTSWEVSQWHTELMDEQTNKSETDQSDIRRPNVLLQDHQWQSTSAVTKHACLLTYREQSRLQSVIYQQNISSHPWGVLRTDI